MSDVLHRLAACGLDVRGTPPVLGIVVTVADETVGLTADDSGDVLEVTAEFPLAGRPDPSLMAAAGLGVPGDTAFAHAQGRLTARRHLADPSVGVAYDALFDLAKATVSLARALAPAGTAASAPAPGTVTEQPGAAVTAQPAGTATAQPAAQPTGTVTTQSTGQPTAAATGQPTAWHPTHVVPPAGMPAWDSPDASGPVAAQLAPGLPLELTGTAGDFAQVRASNGWVGWVDRRHLPPAAPDA